MVRFLMHVAGLDNANSPWYLFFSGIGGGGGLLAVAWTNVRRHNCHMPWCPRVGRHPVPGKHWLMCNRHHRGPMPTADAVAAAHAPQED